MAASTIVHEKPDPYDRLKVEIVRSCFAPHPANTQLLPDQPYAGPGRAVVEYRSDLGEDTERAYGWRETCEAPAFCKPLIREKPRKSLAPDANSAARSK